jgi:hypothetical protein
MTTMTIPTHDRGYEIVKNKWYIKFIEKRYQNPTSYTSYHALSCSGSTIGAISSGSKTLLITRLGVGARLLGGPACALVKDIALINGILLVAC